MFWTNLCSIRACAQGAIASACSRLCSRVFSLPLVVRVAVGAKLRRPGGGICEGNGDGFKYAIEVLIDVGVPKSHDAKSVPCELFRALPLVRQIVIKRMLSAVDLNHQAMAKADNVQDVPSNGCLSPKMKTESPQLS